jgi:Family of unknown function (DUF6196)
MDVTPETLEQTSARLRRVMAHARAVCMAGDYTFAEYPLHEFPAHELSNALAFVRDESSWSALLPAKLCTADADRYLLVSFHFAPDIANSGFVGWLATQFKQQLGTGVFVVCGQNSRDGGVYDYWGIPRSVAMQARGLLTELGANLTRQEILR